MWKKAITKYTVQFLIVLEDRNIKAETNNADKQLSGILERLKEKQLNQVVELVDGNRF